MPTPDLSLLNFFSVHISSKSKAFKTKSAKVADSVSSGKASKVAETKAAKALSLDYASTKGGASAKAEKGEDVTSVKTEKGEGAHAGSKAEKEAKAEKDESHTMDAKAEKMSGKHFRNKLF